MIAAPPVLMTATQVLRPAPRGEVELAAHLSSVFQVAGLHPEDVQLAVGCQAGVLQGLEHAEVGVGQARVLAHHRYAQRVAQPVPLLC